MDRHRGSMTATVGLVVHAAVDGVALGAAATTTQTGVEMIVFLAIMLHKVGTRMNFHKSILMPLAIHGLIIN